MTRVLVGLSVDEILEGGVATDAVLPASLLADCAVDFGHLH